MESLIDTLKRQLPSSRSRTTSPEARTATRGGERGFTLIELAVVVILIGIFAMMAMPQISRQLKDRRTHEAAQRIALIYQQARVRAMGQGGAMLVRFTAGGGQGSFETREALVGTGDANVACIRMPSANCTQTIWTDGDASQQSQSLQTIDLASQPGISLPASPEGLGVFATLTPGVANAASSAAMDVCFTPLGKTYVRYGANDPWVPLTGVPQFSVFRAANASTANALGLVRKVLVLPTGIARLQL